MDAGTLVAIVVVAVVVSLVWDRGIVHGPIGSWKK